MGAKHTPGPWRMKISVDQMSDPGTTIYHRGMCGVYCDADAHGDDEADARLIAAAPEMLSALRRAALALAFAAEKSAAMQDDYEAVSAAIAKATQ